MEVLRAQPAQLMHARILRHDAVTLAQNKIIAPRRSRASVTEIQMRAIKDSKCFDKGKSRRNVTCRTGVRHVDYSSTKGGGIESSMGRRHAHVFKAEGLCTQPRTKPTRPALALWRDGRRKIRNMTYSNGMCSGNPGRRPGL